MSDRRAMALYRYCLLGIALIIGVSELATSTGTIATWLWSDAVMPALRFWAHLLP